MMLEELIKQKSTFVLPKLSYNSLPGMSEQTLSFHHGKHHQAYITKTNELINGNEFQDLSLEDIILKSFNKNQVLFNNAAQVWNHAFFWDCMKNNGGGNPSSKLKSQIDKDFGSIEKFAADFTQAALTQFGSGWAWLVWDGVKLSIVKTGNADTPLTNSSYVVLMTIDVWEHAYYLDYQNKRPDYVHNFFEKLINWEFVEKRFNAL